MYGSTQISVFSVESCEANPLMISWTLVVRWERWVSEIKEENLSSSKVRL